MTQRRAEFVRLRKPERARHLFELAAEFYNAGQRVLILVADDDQGIKLDHFLWTWKRDSFPRPSAMPTPVGSLSWGVRLP